MAKMPPLNEIAWPAARLGELLENLTRKAKLVSLARNLAQPPDSTLRTETGEMLARWLDNAAGYLGIEAEPFSVQYSDLHWLLEAGSPAILRIPLQGSTSDQLFLGLLSGDKHQLRLLCPDLRLRRLKPQDLLEILSSRLEGNLGPLVDEVLEEADVPEEQRARARRAILNDQLAPLRIEMGWILRQPPGARLSKLFGEGKLHRPVWILTATYFIQQLLTVITWLVIGRGIFQGHFEMVWLLAWALLLLFNIPIQIIVNNAQSELSMSAGAIFKQRLLFGTLKLEPEEIRHQGMGQFLGRVMESEAVEMLALSGGFIAILSLVELGLAVAILQRNPNTPLIAWSLVAWIIITLIIFWRYWLISRAWSSAYREMTNDLVENVVGHRTRLIQEEQLHWHDEEDQSLEHYLRLSENLDHAGIQNNAIVSRGWIIVGMTGLTIAFIGRSLSASELAVGLGGVLLAAQGLGKLANGTQSLISLLLAWRQVGPLFNAAARQRELPDLSFVPPSTRTISQPHAENLSTDYVPVDQPLLLARDLNFRYRSQGRPVLQDCSIQIFPGDRILLEGPSGGGKTTLGAVLTGLRIPEAGSLMLWGYDRKILGSEEWRRRVVMAPQFQENYVFSDTFAFNLLMGRRWPPTSEDLAEAESICVELGLGELIQRMPSGFQQVLGESGWQLSHGERSRLFIARALLQGSDLMILDESFGALDPENLARAIGCVLNRAASVLVIAHP